MTDVPKIVDSAIAVHHTATVDEAWNGPAAVANMPNDESTLTYCHAWKDSDGDPEAKSSYKFPHHATKGGPANLAACRNGLARLPGSSIPEGEKPGVAAHLRAHIEDAQGSGDIVRNRRALIAARMANLPQAPERPAPPKNVEPKKWFDFKNVTSTSADIYLYDEISWWGITAGDFIYALNQCNVQNINLHVNSPGGDVFDGIAIMNALCQHPANITVSVDGMAASIASVIAMAGDTVQMCPGSQMMIHDALALVYGNMADLYQMADTLDRISDSIAGIYAQRCGGSIADWRNAMKCESWYSCDEAVMAGLADSVGQLSKAQMEPDMPEPDEPPEPAESPEDRTTLGFWHYRNRTEAPEPFIPKRTPVVAETPIDFAGLFREAFSRN